MEVNRHLLYLVLIILFTLLCNVGCTDEYDYIKDKTNPFNCQLDSSASYIIVLGDLQEYTKNKKSAIPLWNTMKWIYGMQSAGYNINCILQTGDITNDNLPIEYDIFRTTTIPTASVIPYITILGNHDYSWNCEKKIEERSSSLLSAYASFPLTCSHMVSSFEEGKLDNVIYKIPINNTFLYFIALEFAPRQIVIDWADKHVKENPDKIFILMTHEFLDRNGKRINENDSYNTQFYDETCLAPQSIWEKLVYNNDNLRLVLCGHNGFSQFHSDKNANNRDIPQILFNLQYLPDGGSGLVELWKIPKDSGLIKVNVYNTYTNCLWLDNSETIFDSRNAEFSFSLY